MSIESREAATAREERAPAAPLRLQFSLGRLLAAMGLLSVICAALFARPDWLAALFVIIAATIFATVLVTLIVYGRGNLRTFAIGAACPAALVVVGVAVVFVIVAFEAETYDIDDLGNELETLSAGLRHSLVFGALAAPVCGAISVLVRWRLQSRH